ncbi:MAG: ADP-ribosylation factor-like protein [Candidatus Hermodarchaeota archaeon]
MKVINDMKISLCGLAGCGKTSIYLTTIGGMMPTDVRDLRPTVLYEVRSHNYLGLEVSLWDFGGQSQYRENYLANPAVLGGTDVLVFVVDLRNPDHFSDAEKYLDSLMEILEKQNQKPKSLIVLFHKYDTEEGYPQELLEKNYEKAKNLPVFAKYSPIMHTTSIYQQDKLSRILRDMLISDFDTLRKSVESAEDHLKSLNSRIIISDVGGNIIVHNIEGISAGLKLRPDLREFISSCNTLREVFFNTEFAEFHGKSKEGKTVQLNVYNDILAVFIMMDDEKKDPKTKIEALLADMKIFADVALEASEL